jgi:hypothetical protein
MIYFCNVYKKKFSSSKIEKTTTKEHPFSFVLPPLNFTALFFKDIMNNNYFSENMEPYYLVGPLYESGDFQICVTGTKYFSDIDAPISTIQREIEEEVGIDMKDTYSILNDNKYVDEQSKYCLSRIHIKDTNKIVDGNRCIVNSIKPTYKHVVRDVVNHQKRMNLDKKVGCFIYGSMEEIKKIYNTGVNLLYGENKDRITGVVIMPVTDAYEYFKKIVSSVIKLQPSFKYTEHILKMIDDKKIQKNLRKMKRKNIL